MRPPRTLRQMAPPDTYAAAPRRRATKKKRSAKRASKKRTTGKVAKKAASKKRGRRGAKPAPATLRKVEDYLSKNAGEGVSEIAKGAKMQAPAVKKAVAHLLEAGKLKKEGEKRGTKYFVA
jgi:predicted HTH transcriptional regulator